MINPYKPATEEVMPPAVKSALPRSLRVVILVFYLIGGLALGVVGLAGLSLRFGGYESNWRWLHTGSAPLLLGACTLWAPSAIMLVGNNSVSRLRLGLFGTTAVLLCGATAYMGDICLMIAHGGIERLVGSVRISRALLLWGSVVLLVALPIGHKAALRRRFGGWLLPVMLVLALTCAQRTHALHDVIFPFHHSLWCGPQPLLLFALTGVGLIVKRPATKGLVGQLPRLLALTTMLPAAAAAVVGMELRGAPRSTAVNYYDLTIAHSMAILIVVGTIASILAWSREFFGRDGGWTTGLGAIMVAGGMTTTTIGFFVLGLRGTESSVIHGPLSGSLERVCTIASGLSALGVAAVIVGLATGTRATGQSG